MPGKKPTLEELKDRMRYQNVSITKFQKALHEGNMDLVKSMLGDVGYVLVGLGTLGLGLNPLLGGLINVTGKMLVKKFGK